MTDQEHSSE